MIVPLTWHPPEHLPTSMNPSFHINFKGSNILSFNLPLFDSWCELRCDRTPSYHSVGCWAIPNLISVGRVGYNPNLNSSLTILETHIYHLRRLRCHQALTHPNTKNNFARYITKFFGIIFSTSIVLNYCMNVLF